MRVLRPNPGGMVNRNSVPEPVGQKRVEDSTGMESVTALDHIFG